ncbi:MAG: preprotein translocase subunit YajC [Pseudolysinimonas sp.]
MTISTLLRTTGDDAAATGGLDSNLLLNVGLFALLAIVIIFMFRNSRKRRRDQEELQDKMIPGAEVMTQTGIFGTLISIDDDTNQAIIETTPGTKLRVHRQVLARVVEPDEAVATDDAAKPAARRVQLNEDNAMPAGDPQYGERVEDTKPKRAPRKKPTE